MTQVDNRSNLETYLRRMSADELVRVLLRFADCHSDDIAQQAWEVRLDEANAKIRATHKEMKAIGFPTMHPDAYADNVDFRRRQDLFDQYELQRRRYLAASARWSDALDEQRRILDAGPPCAKVKP